MSEPAIRVENLGKQYKIGLRERSHKTFGEAISDLCTFPLRRLRTLGEKSAGDDQFWALRDVSFEVEQGEVVGVIGRNGAGKSTLLKILSRITDPTTGRAVIRGRLRSLLEVGTGFHPELTGRENIYLNGAILGMKRAEIVRKFDEIVAFAEIDRFLDTPVKRYSSGMYVRLAFAVAAHLEPEILLVDEVLAVGDAEFQKRCLGKMGQVAKQGRTVLFVSHNMGAIMELTERCILLSSGRIEIDSSASDAVSRYLKENKSPSLSRDVSDVIRFGDGARHFRLTHVKVLGAENGAVRYGSAMELELEYETTKRLENVTFGLVIKTFLGSQLIHCRSTDDNVTVCTEGAEAGRIRIRIASEHLPPGEYVLGLAAFVAENETLDSLPEALRFDVRADTDTVSDTWVLNKAGIGLRLPSTWELLERMA